MTEADAAAPPPARSSRRGLAIGAAAVALAVVAGAVVYATLSGGGRQPDDVVPGTTYAFVKVDLDPAARQKLAARSFFGKLPKAKSGDDAEQLLDDVLGTVVDDEIDYDADVRPWFDKRAAVAAFPGHVVAVLRSKDDAKAKESLDRVLEDMTYRLTKGYAVIGTAAAVEAALAAAERGTLAGNDRFRADVGRLDGDQVAVAWADLERSYDAFEDVVPLASWLPRGVTKRIKGRVVAGVHLTGDYAEVQGRTIGLEQDDEPSPLDHTLLQGLPADTVAAMSVGDLGQGLAGPLAEFGLDALLGDHLGDLSVADDLVPVLGTEAVVAAGPMPDGLASLRAGVVAKVADGSKPAAVAAKAGDLLRVFGLDVDASVADGRFVLATPGSYAAQLRATDGGLGSTETFRKAMGDLRGTSFALFADAPRAETLVSSLFGTEPTGLTALGLVTGFRDDESYFRLRLVA